MKKEFRCIISGQRNPDLHHVKSRKSGGADDDWNLCPLSRKHHTEIHQLGTTTFANKYPEFKNWLLANGWEYIELLNKWRGPNVRK